MGHSQSQRATLGKSMSLLLQSPLSLWDPLTLIGAIATTLQNSAQPNLKTPQYAWV